MRPTDAAGDGRPAVGLRRRPRAQDAGRDRILRVEVFLGVFIGAVTFTGSIVAFGKLAGQVDGKALKLPGRHHAQRRRAALLCLMLGILYFNGGGIWTLILMTLLAGFIG